MSRIFLSVQAVTFLSVVLVAATSTRAEGPAPLRLQFLGDQGHHQPARRAAELMPALSERGINIQYSEDVDAVLNADNLAKLDGLIVYANIDRITDGQAKALLDFVGQGGGFVPLHCASFCFRNNEEVVALMGAQFQRHGTGTFTVLPTDAGETHPLMKGYRSFESWDETYVHTKHNEKNRTVLEYRREGDQREPWTWVRDQGEGRVFYTAWGHDSRTFSNPGFHNLIERGIRWACKQDPTKAADFAGPEREPLEAFPVQVRDLEKQPFEFVDVGPKIPNYVVSKQWGVQEPPRNLMQKPLPPAESIKHYAVPDGFTISLFASEPEIGGKPIAMAWDERGRLWIAETYDYPNEKQPEGKGRDRIRICEDTDNDGKADKFTIFAEQLSIPTSMAFSNGGLIVHQAPDTLFLKDTDGDDVADVRTTLFSGWSTGDTHAGPSNLNAGPDNWFYGMVGYAGFNGTIAGKQQSFRTGFYRFKVEIVNDQVAVTEFEFLRNTNNNSWGVGFSEDGLLFGSTANRNPSEFMPIANRHYERVRGWTSSVLGGIADNHEFDPITEKVRQVDHHGGYTAAAGHAIYTARTYPQAYWNRAAFVAGPTGHLVGTFALTPQGAGFKSTSPVNLLASDDEWAAPIMAEIGPDGNVWVIDWYNYIVQHNPTPVGFRNGPGNAYMTDLRDKKHGRVYRITYDSHVVDVTEPKTLAGASAEKLVKTLSSSNMFWRRHAQRLLVESGNTETTAELLNLLKRQQLDPIGMDVAAIHAIRVLQGLGEFKKPNVRTALHEALTHPSHAVVRTAIEALPRDQISLNALLSSPAFSSPHAQVRLSALLALAEMPATRRAAKQAAVSLAANESDRWLTDAGIAAAATNGGQFLALACSQSAPIAAAVLRATEITSEHVARSADSKAIELLVKALPESSREVSKRVLNGLTKGWPKTTPIELSQETDNALVALFDGLPAGSKGQLIRLAQIWGSEKLAKNADKIATSLLQIASDEKTEPLARVESSQQLITLMSTSPQAAADLLASITPRTPQSAALGMIDAVRGSRAPGVGNVILSSMKQMTPASRTQAILVLLSRPETTISLLKALETRDLSREDLSLSQQQGLLAHPTPEIRKLAEKVLSGSGGLPSPDREKVLASLMYVTKSSGNVERGKAIYVKNCGNCHMHRGEGKKVGPDLTGMAVHPKAELLTHILDPSRSVEGNYRSYSILTLDGVVVNGMLASETQTAVEIFDAQGKKQVVLREDIERLMASSKSVMPEGFEKQIDSQGFTDLLEFLTDKGRFLPLPLEKAATAISTKGLFHEGDNGADRFVFEDWSPKMVGEVPFQLVDPEGKRVANLILLHGPRGTMPPKMPKSVRVPCNAPATTIHLLSGVSGWGFPAHQQKSVSMIVRLHLADGRTEDHPLSNGLHFADYIRRVDVPDSDYALSARGQQLRHIRVSPRTNQVIREIELVKGDDPTSPIVMAITVEGPKPK
ncbi:MAG: glycosyl hydrolase [Planctomycetaceae bacterium TMED240]|nr:glycosyl hydrolase [Rhodopirellula sp.]OUX05343.1 MAG: glycosyl hydrolase [Planctomycetaceae bacterium TMED240]